MLVNSRTRLTPASLMQTRGEKRVMATHRKRRSRPNSRVQRGKHREAQRLQPQRVRARQAHHVEDAESPQHAASPTFSRY